MPTLSATPLIPQEDAARCQALAALEAKITLVEATLFRRLAPALPSLLLRQAVPQSAGRAAGNAPVTLVAHGRPPENLSRRLAKLRARARY